MQGAQTLWTPWLDPLGVVVKMEDLWVPAGEETATVTAREVGCTASGVTLWTSCTGRGWVSDLLAGSLDVMGMGVRSAWEGRGLA